MNDASALRRAVAIVAAANLAYFGIEFAAALKFGSVSLFADSIDFLEDASVNVLIFFALAWSALVRARVGMGLAAILLAPAIATLWTAWTKIMAPVAPDAFAVSFTGLGALVVNLACAYVLARHRTTSGSLARAAFLSARNDALANVGIIAAGVAGAAFHSAWPDIVIGLAIAAMNADAAREVFEAARQEHVDARA